MSLKTCKQCGGLYGTENLEVFAGTPCSCDNQTEEHLHALRQRVEEAKENEKKLHKALERLVRAVGRLAIDSRKLKKSDLLKAYKQATDALEQLKQRINE